MKKRTSILTALFASLTLASCGGGSGGSVSDDDRNLPDERPVGKISGVAFDGLIINGEVKIYSFENGKIGNLLGSGTTDGEGRFSLNLGIPSTPFVGIVEGGYYLEEATGVQVQVDKSKGLQLRFVGQYQSGRPVETVATFFSTVAAGLAEFYVNAYSWNAETAITRANLLVNEWAGYDVTATIPVDVSREVNITPYITDPHRAGFVAAGISQLTLQISNNANAVAHDRFTSIGFILEAYKDVAADGILDGQGPSGQITFGDIPMNANIYRELLPVRILAFTRGARNLTGLDFDDVLPMASQLNLNTGDLFGGLEVNDIAQSTPSLSQLLPQNGQVISGTWPATVLVEDDYGIQSARWFVDDFYVGQGSSNDPGLDIVTTNFANGEYDVTVEVTNFMGNVESLTSTVTINNGTFALSGGGSYIRYDVTGCNYEFTLRDTTGAGAELVKVNESIKFIDVAMPSGSLTISGFRSIKLSDQGVECRNANVHVTSSYGMEYNFPTRIRKELVGYSFGEGFQFRCSWGVGTC